VAAALPYTDASKNPAYAPADIKIDTRLFESAA
jgi:hypothetical protein